MKKSKFTEQQIAFNRQKAGHRLPRCAEDRHSTAAQPFLSMAMRLRGTHELACASAHW